MQNLHGFTAALGLASVLLIWGLWVWAWRIDPIHAPDVLGMHLLMGVMLTAYPIALLAGLSLRALPYLFYALLLAHRPVSFRPGAPSRGARPRRSLLLFWFLVPPLMADFFLRANLTRGNLLLLPLPPCWR